MPKFIGSDKVPIPKDNEPVLPQRTRDYLEHGAQKGERNKELFDAACQFRDAGFAEDYASGYLGLRAEKDGLSMAEILATIRSAYNRQAREPVHGKNGETLPAAASQEKADPPRLPDPIPDGLKVLLETCFRPGERVAISDTKLNANGEAKPGPGDVYSREAWLRRVARDPVSKVYPGACEGLFIRINPLAKNGKTDKDITALRYCLVEFDLDQNNNRIPKERQYAALLESKLPLSVILDSGNKSIHGWIQVDAPDRAEYDRRRDLAWEYFQKRGLLVDPQNKNPSRYSRCPGAQRNLYGENKKIIGIGHQTLLAVNLGTSTWEEWEKSQIEADYTDQELADLAQIRRQQYRIRDRVFPVSMSKEAFYGIAGEITEIIKPMSEACPEAILGQFLVAFGNLAGRTAYRKQAGVHHLNEFVVLVGPTSRGRKGTAWNAVQNLLRAIDEQWISERMKDGLQSGEAIVHAVRDSVVGIPRGRPKKGQPLVPEVIDPGVNDKRLLLVEEEFGRLLVVAARTGNTLSSTLRKCWDGNQWLYVEGKISPEKATGAHISMIGHVTLTELLECLREVENRNGFSNRVLWLATRRTQKIPLPGWINWKKNHPAIIDTLLSILSDICAVSSREMDWSREGKAAWKEFYNSIGDGNAGIVGSIIARTEAHVLRLTMLYCILDRSTLMEPKHLKAAIAFWQYCERSAGWTFAEKTGSKDADRILWALQHEPQGMSKSQIRDDVFDKHIPKTRLDIALSALADNDLAYMELKRTAKARKPVEWWFEKNH